MKRKILVKIASVMFALNIFNSSIVLAKGQEKKVEEQKKKVLTAKEKNELIEKTLEKNKQRFKDFKKQDYEIEGFSLKVYFKSFVPILEYEHKKTKAKVVLVPIFSNYDGANFLKGFTFFNMPVINEKGINHVLEHLICNPESVEFSLKNFNKESINDTKLPMNAHTALTGINVNYRNDLFKTDEKALKKAYEYLANPSSFKDEKAFKAEIKRILNEIKDNRSENSTKIFGEYAALDEVRNFSELGNINLVKNTKLEDVKELFKNYINPSNSITINYLDLTPKNVKKYLNILNSSYFEKFSYKEPPKLQYKLKTSKPYLLKNWTDKGEIFNYYKNKKFLKKFNYSAEIVYDLNKLGIKNKINFDLGFTEDRIKKFAKSLGYGDCYNENLTISTGMSGENSFVIKLLGDKKELFEEKTLKENANKILNLINKEIDSFKNKDLENSIEKFNARFGFSREDVWKIFADPTFFGKFDELENLILNSYVKTKDPFSKQVFEIDGDKIIFSKKDYVNSVKQNFKVFEKLIKTGPSYIDVLKKDENLKKCIFNEYEIFYFNIPIKFKKGEDVLLENAAKIIFSDYLLMDFYKKGLGYSQVKAGNFYGGFVAKIKGDSKLKEEILSYLKNKENFERLISNFKVTKKDLETFKKSYKEHVTKNVKELKIGLKKLKMLKDDVEKFYKKQIKGFDKKEYGSLTKESRIRGLERLFARSETLENLRTFEFYSDKENAVKNAKKLKKYKDYLSDIWTNYYEDPITQKYLKMFIENQLEPTIENHSQLLKVFENNLKKLDQLQTLKISNLVKTAFLGDCSEIKQEDEILNNIMLLGIN